MQKVKVTVNGGMISDQEFQEYISRGRRNQSRNELVGITITLDGDFADIDYKNANPLKPQRFSICGDMIIENFENLNKAKQAEYLDRIANDIGELEAISEETDKRIRKLSDEFTRSTPVTPSLISCCNRLSSMTTFPAGTGSRCQRKCACR